MGIDSQSFAIDDMVKAFAHKVDKDVKVTKAKSFSGLEDVIIMLSIGGGGVVVKQIANIINNYFLKNIKKKVKTKDIEITGYSAKEVMDILKEHSNEL